MHWHPWLQFRFLWRENVLARGYENRYTLYFLLQANKLACNLSSESREPGESELIPEGRNGSWFVDTIRFHD